MALFKRLAGRTSHNSRAPSNPLPEKIALLLQESRWLILIVVASFLALSLWGYDRADPGWSHAVHTPTLHNPAGRSGAWLADLLLYLFGLSAWWLIALLLVFVWQGYRSLDSRQPTDRRPLYIALAGFFVLIVASSGLETLRFYTLKAPLPVGPGGIVGLELGAFAVRYLGYTGATLTLFALLILGWSIFSGMSWITAAERCGALLERAVVAVRDGFDRWKDRRIGREAAVYRLGFDSRESCERVIGSVGACLAGRDLRDLDGLERMRAADIERRMVGLAEQGTWVWGCWLRPAEVKPRSFASNVGMVR